MYNADAVHNTLMNFNLYTYEDSMLKNLTYLLSEFIHLIERRIRLPSVNSTLIVSQSRGMEEEIHVSTCSSDIMLVIYFINFKILML